MFLSLNKNFTVFLRKLFDIGHQLSFVILLKHITDSVYLSKLLNLTCCNIFGMPFEFSKNQQYKGNMHLLREYAPLFTCYLLYWKILVDGE